MSATTHRPQSKSVKQMLLHCAHEEADWLLHGKGLDATTDMSLRCLPMLHQGSTEVGLRHLGSEGGGAEQCRKGAGWATEACTGNTARIAKDGEHQLDRGLDSLGIESPLTVTVIVLCVGP